MDKMNAEELKILLEIGGYAETKAAAASGVPFPTNFIYYEWNQADKLWVKLRDSDPDPNQASLAPGKFDGQIIEITSK
jgi:hypothetical protein